MKKLQIIIGSALIIFMGAYVAHAQVEVTQTMEASGDVRTSDEGESGATTSVLAEGEMKVEERCDTTDNDCDDQDPSVSPEARDTDSDGDGLEDADDDGDSVSTAGRGVVKELDKATPLLFKADGSTEAGFEVEVDEETRGNGDLDGDGYLDVAFQRVKMNAEEVRGWDAEKKEAVRTRLEQNSEVNSANDFGLQVAQAALDRAEIRNIESTETETAVEYETEVKLFGFIPMSVRATARAQAEGEASVDYPWYVFLASKGEQEAYLSLAQELRASHDAAINAVRNVR